MTGFYNTRIGGVVELLKTTCRVSSYSWMGLPLNTTSLPTATHSIFALEVLSYNFRPSRISGPRKSMVSPLDIIMRLPFTY